MREPQSAMRCLEQPPVQGLWSPRSAMEAMNQSGQPRNSGKRGPMRPAPLTSGGLTLEEITCRGWGPHLQYSFLIKLASQNFKVSQIETRGPKGHILDTGIMCFRAIRVGTRGPCPDQDHLLDTAWG